MNSIVENLLKEMEKCNSKNNRCDYLLEHSEIDYLLEYIDQLQQERNNYKELYEKEKEKWEALKQKTINLFNRSQDICYLNILEIMQEIESRNK